MQVNNGERPKYYVENNHPAIIDAATFGRAQEERARRSGKRKVKQVGTKTEQGKYCGKYALTELLLCGECGTPYRRCTWTAAVNISAGYYNEHRLHEVIDSFALQNDVERITRMVQTQTEKFPYMKRKTFASSFYRQQTLFDMGFDSKEKEKLLMELPKNARLMVNGYEIIPACTYLMDKDGNVYAGVPELGAAVLSENAVACDENGELLSFSVFDAKRTKVISMESAMEQLAMDIAF